MPVEPKHVFGSAVAGNVAPILLKWYTQEGISLPGETLGQFVGWFLAMAFFAIFAGVVATFIWKEKTTQRAFFIGLALPYLLWGFIADAQLLAQPRRARAQAEKPAPGAPAAPAAPEQPGSPIWLKTNGHTGPPRRLTIQILGADEGKKTPLDKARTSLLRADALTEPGLILFGSTVKAELWPGKYRLRVDAPGYFSKTVDIDIGAEEKALTLELPKSSFIYEFWKGAGSVLFPYSPPGREWRP